MKTAKVFYSGRSQAVRIPRAFRFRDKEVAIRREGETVLLEPIRKKAWPRGFWQHIRIDDPSFARPTQGAVQSRRRLDGKD